MVYLYMKNLVKKKSKKIFANNKALNFIFEMPIIIIILFFSAFFVVLLFSFFVQISYYFINLNDLHKNNKFESYSVVNHVFYVDHYVATKKIQVPLNWHNTSSNKKISLSVYKLVRNNPKRVYVLIPGGPDQPALLTYDYAKELYDIDKNSEIILFDHRGTGESTFLGCKGNINVEDSTEIAKKCINKVNSKYGDDLKYFTSEQAAFDLKYILSEYKNIPITIYGGSYGTIVAEQLAKIGDSNVDTYILDSIAYPVDKKLSNDYHDEALDNYIKICTKTNSCNSIDGVKDVIDFKKYAKNILNKCNSKDENNFLKDIYNILQFDRNKLNFDKLILDVKNCDKKNISSIVKNINGESYSNIFRSYWNTFQYGHTSHYMHSLISCNEIDPTNKVCSLLPRYKTPIITDVHESKNSRYLLISGSTDASTNPKMARDVYNILPNKKILLSVIGRSHIPLGHGFCNANIVYKFSNGETNIRNINGCSDFLFDVTSNYF